MIVVGVDPGARGGIWITDTQVATGVGYRMPLLKHRAKACVSASEIKAMLQQVDVVVIEDVHAMPRQGVSSSFQFGRMFGAVEALAIASGAQVELVTPATWKKHHRLSRDKRASLDLASTLYPTACDWRVLANEGIAEAALIARWWMDKRRL